MVRVVIVDDHFVVRQGLRQMLHEPADDAADTAASTITVVGEAAHGIEALQILRTQPVDVLILDMSMPGRSGIELIRQIKGEFPALAILVLSMHSEEQFALRAIKAGASAYLTKGGDAREVLHAVRKLASGHPYITPQVAECLALGLSTYSTGLPHERLSDREYQIFSMLITGQGVTEIGVALAISSKTVSTYKARILEKMELSNTAELIRYAIEHGLDHHRPGS